MNLQTIRYRFSIFLKQFRIEDLKLLMKFLNEIVIEYKNSKSSRLFGKYTLTKVKTTELASSFIELSTVIFKSVTLPS